MAKLVLDDLTNITGQETSAINTLNENFASIETAVENTLSRDGTSPNAMNANLDMNDNDILNVGALDVATLTLNGNEVSSTELLALGYNGWSPVLAVVSDTTRRVLQITGWVGGEGTAPTDYVNYYIGSSGPVASIGSAVDIRGAAGAGTGDMVGSNNLSDVTTPATAFANIKQSATTSATGVVELATDAEAQALASTSVVLTPSNLAAVTATETRTGVVELATTTEANTGTDTARAVTPAGLAAYFAGHGSSINVQQFTANGTWNKPSSGTVAWIYGWGGGGSGARATSGEGAGGGGGGAFNELIIPLSSLASSVSVTVASGGAARTTNSNGLVGGNTSFGSHLTIYGGGGGSESGAAGGGGGGGGMGSAGSTATASGGNGGTMGSGQNGGIGGAAAGDAGTSSIYGGGGGGGEDSNGGASEFGGGGGGGGSGTGPTGGNGGNSYRGGAGGGGGGNTNPSSGGVSIFGGNGGAGATGTTVAGSGSVPGGGGGGSENANSGAGGRGELWVIVF